MSHTGDVLPSSDKYVGEFVVNGLPPGTNENIIPLKPALPLTTAQWDALKASAATAQWVIYDKMPTDSRDVFVGLSEDEIRGIFSGLAKAVGGGDAEFEKRMAAVADEFIYDDQAPSKAITDRPELAEFVVTDGKQTRFLRPLRDYQTIFQTAAKRLTEMTDRIQVLSREKDFAVQALANLKDKTIPALDVRKVRIEKELALIDAELKVVQSLSMQLTTAIEKAKQEIVQGVLENRRLLQESAAGGKVTAAPPAAQPVVPQPLADVR
ncbi:MAG: hypothetical protein QM775_01865 [Pirellulales bacterium]